MGGNSGHSSNQQEEAIVSGMKEKAEQFKESGSEIYMTRANSVNGKTFLNER